MEESRFPRVIESGGVVLTLTPVEAYIEFGPDLPHGAIGSFLEAHHLQPVDEQPGLQPGPSLNAAGPESRWVRLPAEASLEESLERFLRDDRVRLASPVYHRADLLPRKTGISFAEFVLVWFRPGASDQEIATLIDQLGTEDVTSEFRRSEDRVRRVRIREPKRRHALDVAEQFRRSPVVGRAYPDWAQLHSATSAKIPQDPYWAYQWNMTKIGAPDGWGLSQGDPAVRIAILDSGCDLAHEDLVAKYVPVADRRDVVANTNTPDDDHGHGTCVAGIAAAETDNNLGVAGVGWKCSIMPIRMMVPEMTPYGWETKIKNESWVSDAIDWARLHGAHVINMSFHWDGPHTTVDAAIAKAHTADIVLVAASGNQSMGTTSPPGYVDYPASHPLVMAVGASDQSDLRCSWSLFGPTLDVVAPGIGLCTTDRMGANGFNHSGNYVTGVIAGTSLSAPHVAGLAGLLRSHYPKLTNVQVRSIIEKTAEKVSKYAYPYKYDSAHPSGAWIDEMGYGRINVFRALDFADVYIKDNPADDGRVPFIGNFWDDSDIIIRQTNSGPFLPQQVKKGQTNYIHVRVTNLGPATARNVKVTVRAVPFAGTQFVYPNDWKAIDATHLQPADIATSFPTLLPGATAIAQFSLSAAQVNQLFGWENLSWHPCLLSEVTCDNDYNATPEGVHTWESNNLGQRNLTKLLTGSGSTITFPFVAGNRLNTELYMELEIDRHKLPREIELLLNPSYRKTSFPGLEPRPPGAQTAATFLDRTRLAISACGCNGILTLEAGSAFEGSVPGAIAGEREDASLSGAEWVERQGERVIAIREDRARIGLQKRPGEMRPMSLTFRVPAEARRGDSYQLTVSQRNATHDIVGGVTLVAELME